MRHDKKPCLLDRENKHLREQNHRLHALLVTARTAKDELEIKYVRLMEDHSKLNGRIYELESAVEKLLEMNETETDLDKLFEVMLDISRLFLDQFHDSELQSSTS